MATGNKKPVKPSAGAGAKKDDTGPEDTGEAAGADRDIPIPRAKKIKAPTWISIVGAVAGILTLLAFLGLTFASGLIPGYDVCASYLPLSAAFALGTGLAVSFIGGEAAIAGRLGLGLQRNAVAFSAGGGIAAMLIVLVLFFFNKPSECEVKPVDPELTLTVSQIPEKIDPLPVEGVWSNRSATSRTGDFTTMYRLNGIAKTKRVRFADVESRRTVCEIVFDVIDAPDKQTEDEKRYEIESADFTADGPELVFVATLDPVAREEADEDGRESSPECFTIYGRPMAGYVAVSKTDNKLKYGKSLKPGFEAFAGDAFIPQSEPIQTASISLEFLAFVTAAQANGGGEPTYDELKGLLASENPNVRVDAREYLTAHFDTYKGEVIAEVLATATPHGDYLASLLSALIEGIDRDTDGRLAPGIPDRDLAIQLPLIPGAEQRIVDLTASSNAAVAKQARRLVQRYPLDTFDAIYAPLLEPVASAPECAPLTSQQDAMIYGAIFFEYNRIILHNWEPTLTAEAEAESLKRAELVLGAARCLSDELRVDRSLVLFGLATLYNEAGGPPADKPRFQEAAKQRANEFLATTEADGGADRYYYQAHVRSMRDLAA